MSTSQSTDDILTNNIRQKIITSYVEAKDKYEAHLMELGAKRFPPLYNRHGVPIRRGYQFAILAHYMGSLVHKDMFSDLICDWFANTRKDQQPRHLKDDGFNILGCGRSHDILPVDADTVPYTNLPSRGFSAGEKVPTPYIILVNLSQLGHEFSQRAEKRAGILTATEFEDLLRAYGYKCGHCGASDVPLEHGHKDPSKGVGIKNIIPLCVRCNNWQNDDYILDDSGRVAGLLSSRAVRKSSEDVRRRILLELVSSGEFNTEIIEAAQGL